MAATGEAPIFTLPETSLGGSGATQSLLDGMLRAHKHVSDLIFSPGRLPQVEVHGQLITVQARGLRQFTADDTRRIASDLIGNNKQAITMLREQGFCDVSYGVPGLARFRVNVFIQRGSCAVVMRVIPTSIPDLATLGLPKHLSEVASLRDGIVFVTGGRGTGKSSTLAALLDRINEERVCHIITIEDPIEFLHNHKRATVHQRELHSDTPSIATGLRASLRQAPDVIFVAEMRDRETVEMVIEAAETGHLVLSSMNTADAAKTIERVVGSFSPSEQESMRSRLARTLRVTISQRLIPRKDGNGRVLVVEILKYQSIHGKAEGTDNLSTPAIASALRDGAAGGMQNFDAEIEKLVRNGIVDPEIALSYASDPSLLREKLLKAPLQ